VPFLDHRIGGQNTSKKVAPNLGLGIHHTPVPGSSSWSSGEIFFLDIQRKQPNISVPVLNKRA
jgi:hypothetical protein